MTEFEALVSLNLCGHIGSTRLKKLLDFFAKPQDIFKESPQKLMGVSGIGQDIAGRIHVFKECDLEKELKSVNKHNLTILTLNDRDYPENLKEIPDPPIVLYVKGKLEQEDKFAIGIVGSRKASFYGLTNAQDFGLHLAGSGLTVVSGMAQGIDTYAHKGALKQGGRTIAVMGSGFNNIYPAANKKLSEEICAHGAVISEFPMDMLPLPQNFPCRNRVISGLSLGVLVVEAARNSGALITADFALEQGREVFALPGKVDSNTSFGTNELIKQGAKLVSCLDDILQEIAVPIKHNLRSEPQIKSKPHPIDEEENRVYELIEDQSVPMDEIMQKTNLDIPKISAILLSLQLKRLIRQLPGRQFVRSQKAIG